MTTTCQLQSIAKKKAEKSVWPSCKKAIVKKRWEIQDGSQEMAVIWL